MTRRGIERTLAGLAAIIGWAGLALQYWLAVEAFGFGSGSWRFLAFFTILAGIGAALVSTAVATGGKGALASPKAKFVAATSVALVGLVYSLWLDESWNPQGPQRLANLAQHQAVPILFIGMWLAGLHEQLKWRDFIWALLPPVAYSLYALARGGADGFYAHWFFYPPTQTASEVASGAILMLVVVSAIAVLLLLIDHWIDDVKDGPAARLNRVDEAGRESFPASDAPDWTLGKDRE